LAGQNPGQIRQGVLQVLQHSSDPTSSEPRHGFRPKRSAHQAVAKAQKYIVAGHRWVVSGKHREIRDLADGEVRGDELMHEKSF
jgi:hypothetical protein